MVATCSVGSMLYVLPMLLGRTYDINNDIVGVDIYDKKDIDAAMKNPIINPVVTSVYTTIEESSEKREFLGVSGELNLKISAGLLDIKGAGDYLKSTTKTVNSLEILVKMTFNTMIVEINPDAKPLTYWQLLDRSTIGTHVVNSMTYGGEVYASVKFVALKSEYMQEIKAQVQASISKSGAFDVAAQGKLDMLAKNISSKAKLEIDYYGTVPLDDVPTTIEGLSKLVSKFEEQVKKVNNGNGVALCASFNPLSKWDTKFNFLKNKELMNALDDFNYHFNDLREAKALLQGLIGSLPQMVKQDYLKKVIDFSGRLTDTLREFHKAIGTLDLEKGSGQLNKAEDAFDKNSKIFGDSKYSKEVRQLIKEMDEKVDPTVPRGVFVEWGSKTCSNKGSNILYIGFMASFMEQGIGAGTQYQCLPENPDWTLPPDTTGVNQRTSKLGGVRYKSMSVFQGSGKRVENKTAPCVVCETPMRPTVQMFPGFNICPGDWVPEYTGFLVSTNRHQNRAEYVCVVQDPDTYEPKGMAKAEPFILPSKIGGENTDPGVYTKDAAVPCSVCSK